jgi:hypothetical protein
MYQEDMTLKKVEMDPIVFKATSDLDTLYMHEAMKAPDADQFKEAMRREVKEHTHKGHWKVVRKEERFFPQFQNIAISLVNEAKEKDRDPQGVQA